MRPWVIAIVLACGLADVLVACGDDAQHRVEPEGESGAGGRNGDGQPSRNIGGDGGTSSAALAGNGGAPPDGNAGVATSSAGDSGAGNRAAAGNDGGAGGPACDGFDDLLGPRALCSNLRTCYPDLQGVQSACVAPGDDDVIDSYSYFDFAHYSTLPAIRACLCALADPQPARAWTDCWLAAEPAAAACFGACPTLGNGCADPYSAATDSCNAQHQAGYLAVATCLAAK